VNKDYQTSKIDTTRIAVPEQVSIALGEITTDLREGLLALAVGAGLRVLTAMVAADVAAACGPRDQHNPDRTAVGHGAGSVPWVSDGCRSPGPACMRSGSARRWLSSTRTGATRGRDPHPARGSNRPAVP
jgi:hypothetical protein